MEGKNEKLVLLGKIISRVLGPFSSAPLIFFLLVFVVTDNMTSRLLAWGVLFFAFYIVPGVAYLGLRSVHNITDLELTKREERHPLLEIMLVSYWLSVYYFVEMFGFTSIISEGVLLYVCVFTVLTIITVWYKISLHMAMWVVVGLFLADQYGPMYYLFMAVVIPLVGWARLYLKKHTMAQLVLGFIVPVLVFIAVKAAWL